MQPCDTYLPSRLETNKLGQLLARPLKWQGSSDFIGYARAAEVAKESAKTGKPIPDLLREKKLLPEEEIARIFTPEFLAGQGD